MHPTKTKIVYLSPPNRALVLSVDEKSQIQALDREQPVLPMMPGVPERRTHSYVRHGTTRGLPLWMSPPALSSANATSGTVPPNSWISSSRSMRAYRPRAIGGTAMSTQAIAFRF